MLPLRFKSFKPFSVFVAINEKIVTNLNSTKYYLQYCNASKPLIRLKNVGLIIETMKFINLAYFLIDPRKYTLNFSRLAGS